MTDGLRQLENSVNGLGKQMGEMNLKVNDMDDKVSDMLTVLSGNDLDPTDNGFVGKVHSLTARVTKLEKLKDRMFYIIIGVSIPGGYGIANIAVNIAKAISGHQ